MWINEVYWHKVVLVLNDNITIHCLYVIIWAAISGDEEKERDNATTLHEYIKETPTNYIKQEANMHVISCGNQCFIVPLCLSVSPCRAMHGQTFKNDWYARDVNITVDWHLRLVHVSAAANTYRYNFIVSMTHLHGNDKVKADALRCSFFIFFRLLPLGYDCVGYVYENNKMSTNVDFGLVG